MSESQDCKTENSSNASQRNATQRLHRTPNNTSKKTHISEIVTATLTKTLAEQSNLLTSSLLSRA